MKICCSDPEGQGDKKKKDRHKVKRKKPSERQMPNLTIINLILDKDGPEVVECQLETAKHSAITFRFNTEDDQPSDIAENLVINIIRQFLQIVCAVHCKLCVLYSNLMHVLSLLDCKFFSSTSYKL